MHSYRQYSDVKSVMRAIWVMARELTRALRPSDKGRFYYVSKEKHSA